MPIWEVNGSILDEIQQPLILAGTKGYDATAACPPFRTSELHLQIEFTYLLFDDFYGFEKMSARTYRLESDLSDTIQLLKDEFNE